MVLYIHGRSKGHGCHSALVPHVYLIFLKLPVTNTVPSPPLQTYMHAASVSVTVIAVAVYFQGWLVDLVNKFGSLEGFQIFLDRFTNGPPLSVTVVSALIR